MKTLLGTLIVGLLVTGLAYQPVLAAEPADCNAAIAVCVGDHTAYENAVVNVNNALTVLTGIGVTGWDNYDAGVPWQDGTAIVGALNAGDVAVIQSGTALSNACGYLYNAGLNITAAQVSCALGNYTAAYLVLDVAEGQLEEAAIDLTGENGATSYASDAGESYEEANMLMFGCDICESIPCECEEEEDE